MRCDPRNVENRRSIVLAQSKRCGVNLSARSQRVGDRLQPVHAGLLLTGGQSSRMGRDKASIVIGGASLAERAAAALRSAATRLVCVGPEAGTGFPAINDPGQGPLAAFDEGCRWLRNKGHDGPVIVLACDMPLVGADVIKRLIFMRRGADAAVPIANGMLQPLAAVYAPAAIAVAERLAAGGVRSMRDLLARIKLEVGPARVLGVGEEAFDDLDTPQDVERATAILEAPA